MRVPNPFRKTPLPPLDTMAQYEAEAREDRMLFQFWGWLEAGVLNPGVVKRRYERHREWYGVEILQWRVWLAWTLVACAMLGSGVFLFFFTAASNEQRVQPTSPWAGFAAGAGVCLIVFAIPVGGWISSRRYSKSYGPLTIWQRDPKDPRQMVEGRRGHVPRLCFLTPHPSGEPWYRAPTRQSAELEGSIHLWWPDEMGNIQDWHCNPNDIWKLPPAVFGIDEVAASRYASYIETEAEDGRAWKLAEEGPGWALFNEVWPVIVIVVGFIMLLFIVAGGQES